MSYKEANKTIFLSAIGNFVFVQNKQMNEWRIHTHLHHNGYGDERQHQCVKLMPIANL